MKKLILFISIVLSLSISAAEAQNCDCESLQKQIYELQTQMDLLKGKADNIDSADNELSPVKIVFDGTANGNDVVIFYMRDLFGKLQANDYYTVSLNYIMIGRKNEKNFFEIFLVFDNQSPFTTTFEKQVWIEASQNNERLHYTAANGSDLTSQKEFFSNHSGYYTLAFELYNFSDDITVDIYEVNQKDEEIIPLARWIIPLSELTVEY